MQIEATLVMAMDFRARKGVRHEVYSYQQDGIWYVVKCGPKYSNTYRVTQYDVEGLAKLKSIERLPSIGEALLNNAQHGKATE